MHILDSCISWKILSQVKSVLSCLAQSRSRLSYIPGSCSINCTKTKLAASSTSCAVLINKWITETRYRTADTRNPLCNATVRSGLPCCLEVEFLSLPHSWVAVSSICAVPFSSMYSTQVDNNSRKLWLCCCCQFPWCALPLTFSSFTKVLLSWQLPLKQFIPLYRYLVCCKLINFVVKIFPNFIPEMPAGFTSYIVQSIPIYFSCCERL
jgi:hypothetical protein